MSCALLLAATAAEAQYIQYPNGKRVKMLGTRSGAYQLHGNQQRYIVSPSGRVYEDPKEEELFSEQARARMGYPNQQEPTEEEALSADSVKESPTEGN